MAVVGPTVTIEQAPGQIDPAPLGTVTFTVQFSDAVTGFNNLSDVVLSGTATASVTSITPVSADFYTVTVTVTAPGTVIATVPAGVATDSISQGNLASSSVDHQVSVEEAPSLIVTTALDVVDALDGKTSLREAVAYANSHANTGVNTPDVITFDSSVFTGGAASLIRLTQGEIVITDAVTIDGSVGTGIVITGDKNNNDVTVGTTDITDVAASSAALLADNSRIFNISNTAGTTLESLTFTGGRTTISGEEGGAVSADGNLTILNSTIAGNSTAATESAGGGLAVLGTLTLTDSILSGNIAEGAVKSQGGGAGAFAMVITGSTISGNSSETAGGGLFAPNISLTNSTVWGNAGTQGGGGILGGQIDIHNSTVTGNTALGAGASGGAINAIGSLTLENSIVLGNRATASNEIFLTPADPGNNIPAATLTASGANIVGANASAFDTTGYTNIINGNPLGIFAQIFDLDPNPFVQVLAGILADNGGPVQTVALSVDVTNPALDAGTTALTTDGRGLLRSVDLPGVGTTHTADLGAYELQTLPSSTAQSFVVTTASDELDYTGPDATLALMGGAADLSLREAIVLANQSRGTADTVTFDSAVFTGGAASLIRLTHGQIEITDAITIDGSTATGVLITGDKNNNDVTVGATDITDVAASGKALLADNSRIFDMLNGTGNATLKGLTLTGGHTIADAEAGGAVRVFASDLTVSDSTITGNSTEGFAASGGGIDVFGSLTLTNSTLSDNSTAGTGKGYGGGAAASDMVVTNSIVTGNSTAGSDSSGGGLDSAGTLDITGSTISNNSTAGDSAGGGGIHGDVVTVTASIVNNNSTRGAAGGGGIFGDIQVTLTNSTVSGNSALADFAVGGGILSGGLVELHESTVSGNSVVGNVTAGGGIAANTVELTNSTIYGNSVDGGLAKGGGVWANTSITAVNSTVTGNTVIGFSVEGGGLDVNNATVTLTNSIVLGNYSSTTDSEIAGAFTLTGSGLNVVGPGTDTDASDHIINADPAVVFAQTADNNGVAAGVLADNGGPVRTVSLKFDATNPAIDAATGSPPATDARGQARQDLAGVGNDGANFADLGAFETIDARPTVGYTPALLTIAENASTATRIKVADFNITDPDGHNALSLSGADAAFFEILNDAIYLRAGAALDFETKPQLNIIFDVQPLGYNLYRSEAVLTVTDVNEAPRAVNFTNVLASIAENASTATRTKVANIIVTDDALGTETITLGGADAAKFEVINGVLYIKAGTVLDFETNPSLDIIVNVNDPAVGGPVDVSRALSLKVTDVLEALNGTGNPDTLNGGAGAERINGLAGNDTINGGGGNDQIIGGAGADRLTGGGRRRHLHLREHNR